MKLSLYPPYSSEISTLSICSRESYILDHICHIQEYQRKPEARNVTSSYKKKPRTKVWNACKNPGPAQPLVRALLGTSTPSSVSACLIWGLLSWLKKHKVAPWVPGGCSPPAQIKLSSQITILNHSFNILEERLWLVQLRHGVHPACSALAGEESHLDNTQTLETSFLSGGINGRTSLEKESSG